MPDVTVVRAFAIFVVACYALNSQNFRSVLTPVVVAVEVGGTLNGTFTALLSDNDTDGVCDFYFASTKEKEGMRFTRSKKEKWAIVDADDNVMVEAKEEGGNDPAGVEWPDITVSPIVEPAISNLLLLFLCHIGGILYSWVFATKWGKHVVKEIVDRYGIRHIVLSGACMTFAQMGINYLWSLASTRMPIQTLSAIFQSSAFLVYLLSIPILGEKCTQLKSLSVLLSGSGVVIATMCAPTSAVAGTSILGISFAVAAELYKASYQVWFKYVFNDPGMKFLLFMMSVVAWLHVILILPLIILAHSTGWEPMVFNVWNRSYQSLAQVGLAAFCASSVNVGSLLVISWSSPTLWSITQTLIIPFSVVLDYLISSLWPSERSLFGHFFILLAVMLFHFDEYQMRGCHPERKGKVKYEELEASVPGDARNTTNEAENASAKVQDAVDPVGQE